MLRHSALWFNLSMTWFILRFCLDRNYKVKLQIASLLSIKRSAVKDLGDSNLIWHHLLIVLLKLCHILIIKNKSCKCKGWFILRIKHFTTERICHWPCRCSHTCVVDLPEVNLRWQTGRAGGRAFPWRHQCHHQTELYLWRCLW